VSTLKVMMRTEVSFSILFRILSWARLMGSEHRTAHVTGVK
jgi:hypothetical protein